MSSAGWSAWLDILVDEELSRLDCCAEGYFDNRSTEYGILRGIGSRGSKCLAMTLNRALEATMFTAG